MRLEQGAQFRCRLHGAFLRQMVGPFQMDRTGNRAAARRAPVLAGPFRAPARIQDDAIARTDGGLHVAVGRQSAAIGRKLKNRRARDRRIARDRQAGGIPSRITTVKNMNVAMAEILQKPKPPRGRHAGDLAAEHDRVVEGHAAPRQQECPHAGERFERRVVGVVAIHRIDVVMPRAGDMAHGEPFAGPNVDQPQGWIVKTREQRFSRPKQVRVRIPVTVVHLSVPFDVRRGRRATGNRGSARG